jgi:hypothetical protein
VVPIYDLGRVDDSYFIAMPFIHGLTVQAMMKEANSIGLPVPCGIACEIVRQALAGLHYAHERVGLAGEAMMLVHRDVHKVNNPDPTRLQGLHLVESYAEAAAVLYGLEVIDEPTARAEMKAAQADGLAITDAEIDALVAAQAPDPPSPP